MKTHAGFLYEASPFPQCHASTLAETSDGIVAAWFGGSRESDPDVCIWIARCRAGTWSAPQLAADGLMPEGQRYACWNPVLFQPRSGPLLLFYKVGPNPRDWWGMWQTSPDQGHSWSPAARLPDGILGPVKNKPIQLPGGDLLCPSSTEHRQHGWQIHVERTPDLGQTWSRTPPINEDKDFGAIQPSLLTYADGRIEAVCRTRQGVLAAAWSEDAGATWGAMSALALPNPNSGTDAVTLADGRQLLVYNHSATERTPLNIALSTDGNIWHRALTLEDQPGEYSYPAVIQSSDNLVHVSYTWHRTRIRHVTLDPRLLT